MTRMWPPARERIARPGNGTNGRIAQRIRRRCRQAGEVSPHADGVLGARHGAGGILDARPRRRRRAAREPVPAGQRPPARVLLSRTAVQRGGPSVVGGARSSAAHSRCPCASFLRFTERHTGSVSTSLSSGFRRARRISWRTLRRPVRRRLRPCTGVSRTNARRSRASSIASPRASARGGWRANSLVAALRG